MKQYDFRFYNVKNVLYPVEKGDKVDSVDVHLTYNYKRDERNPNRMLLEHINMDYSLRYHNAKNGNAFGIRSNLFFLFYDYENPFAPPFFREVEMYSDYVKIWTFPHMEAFWEQNYFLPQNEKKEEHLRFFEKHGIVKTEEEADFKPDIAELHSPLQAWSKERIDLARMPMNAMFSSSTEDAEVFDLRKLKLSDDQYNVDAQIFLNYFCQGDSLHFVTKTFINLDKSYFLPTPNAYASAFVNMLFDLFEMSRRNLDSVLKQLKTCQADEIKAIYDEEIKQLGKNIKRFKIETNHATDIDGLLHWFEIINDSLKINNSLLTDIMPQAAWGDNEASVFAAYHYNTGIILLKLGQYEEACRYFTKALEKWTFNAPVKAASGYYNRAIAYYHLGEMELFCDDLQKVIEIEGASEETTELLKLCGE